MGIGAAVIGAGALSAGASVLGSGEAASADKSAADAQEAQYNQTRSDLLPYQQTGQAALGEVQGNLPGWEADNQDYLTADLNQQYQANDLLNQSQGLYNKAQDQFTTAAQIGQGAGGQAALAATPGYQFQLNQGLQAVQNSAAARGLGVSGAALKGAATFATGLASSNYQQQYQDAVQNAQNTQSSAAGIGGLSTTSQNIGQGYLNANSSSQGNLTNQYNRLMGVANLGENAAAQTGVTGAQLANQAGQATIAGGNALAAGSAGVGNAVTGATNNLVTSNLLSSALSGGTSASGAAGNSLAYAAAMNPTSAAAYGPGF